MSYAPGAYSSLKRMSLCTVMLSEKGTMSLSQHRALAVGLLLEGLVLVIDLCAPLGVAVGVLYVAVLPVALLSRRRADVAILATVGTALVLVGLFAKTHAAIPLPLVHANRGISLAAIWTVAALILSHLARAQKLTRAREESHAFFRQALEAAPDGIRIIFF